MRLGFVLVGFPALEQCWRLREDADGYGQIAQTIREGHYDDVTRGPVYPLLVAVAGSTRAVKLLQAGLDSLVCVWLWWIAGTALGQGRDRGGAPPRPGVLAAWLWAVYPFAIWRVAFINKEVVLTFLLAAYVCVQLRARNSWQWIVAGVLLGVVNLCRPTFLLWPLVLVGHALACRSGSTRKSVPYVGVLIAAMLLVIAPWTYRNWRLTGGEFLPVATEAGGVTTFVGNYQPTLGLWEGPGKPRWQAAVDEIKRQNTGASVVELDRAFYRAAWQQAAGNPLKAGELFVRKCGRFWFLSAARREQLLSCAIQGGYLALLGIGLWRARPWSREVIVMVALIGYVMLVHALSYADLRFSLPVMPYVCALGAVAFARR